MESRIRNRLLFLGLLTALAVVLALPSFRVPLPAPIKKVLPGDGMRLGLDLQGGMHLVLKVEVQEAAKAQLDLAQEALLTLLREQGVERPAIEALSANTLRLTLPDTRRMSDVLGLLRDQFRGFEVRTPSATSLELVLNEDEIRRIEEGAVEQSLEIIRNRIDQFGVAEPVILRQGNDEIVVQLPGVKEPARAIELIGRTAQLEFKLVNSAYVPDLPGLVREAQTAWAQSKNRSGDHLNRQLADQLPPGSALYPVKPDDTDPIGRAPEFLLVNKRTLMTGGALQTAKVTVNPETGAPYISLEFNDRGARLFESITRNHVGQQLAIVLDDVVQSAPVIQEAIAGGQAQITGAFSTEDARDLAIVLRAGALPAPVSIAQNMVVGPSLGQDSITNGVASAAIGFLLVVVFMAVYYRLSGVIANAALLLNLLFMAAALSVFRATLTLPGLAGIVLSIGMAVDSNVLIFERMREEFPLRPTVRGAVEAGYDKAFWTIVDSHVTTLITALALFLFGTGPVKGFAVTLSIGVVFNLFTAIYGTRVVYAYLYYRKKLKPLRFRQLLRQPAIDFIRLRKAAFIFSGILVALGVAAMIQIQRGRANLGVDFTGGTLVQLKADSPFALGEVRNALDRNQLADYELQEVPEAQLLLIRVKPADQTVGSLADRIVAILARELPNHRFILESQAEISGSISSDLQRAALIAVGISLLGIIGYLAWRFDWKFGIAAAAATFHDVLAVLGLFFLLDKEITLLVVTALLTLAGYSLTDTVVVFDRIRENLNKPGGGKKDLGALINLSINEVLSRTLVTSGTVLLVLAALLIAGGLLLRDFSLALIIGVLVGTYSSVFVASPIIYSWHVGRRRTGRAVKSAAQPPSGRIRRSRGRA
ncbi:MAG: protein translocase subunit SecD [Desulfobacteraceae bacterium]|jgi:SecD/SecF fusion protein|nr:protein translocase subunit SecD [Desulfobacteraceae bacterium]